MQYEEWAQLVLEAFSRRVRINKAEARQPVIALKRVLDNVAERLAEPEVKETAPAGHRASRKKGEER